MKLFDFFTLFVLTILSIAYLGQKHVDEIEQIRTEITQQQCEDHVQKTDDLSI